MVKFYALESAVPTYMPKRNTLIISILQTTFDFIKGYAMSESGQ
ncbi:hypothetical protein ABID22_003615 [Pontibacter aydingkolensis]